MKSITTLLATLMLHSPLLAQEPAPAAPAPAAPPASAEEVTKLVLGVTPMVMKFDKAVLEVKAGAKVMILFKNDACGLSHNLLIIKPGSTAKIGALADAMVPDVTAMKKFYFPDSPDVLFKGTKLVNVGQTDLIEFTAPSEPGDYPYICTYPGHWRSMNGILKVKP